MKVQWDDLRYNGEEIEFCHPYPLGHVPLGAELKELHRYRGLGTVEMILALRAENKRLREKVSRLESEISWTKCPERMGR